MKNIYCKQSNKKNIQSGFALIYVLLMVAIISITIASMVALSLSDIRQMRKVWAKDGAFQMAQSGLEDGISNLQLGPESRLRTETYFSLYKSQQPGGTGYSASRNRPSLQNDKGEYYFKINADNTIDAIGYFKGNKVKLRAECNADATSCNIFQTGF